MLWSTLPHTPVLTHRTQKLHEYLGYDEQPFDSAQGRLFGMQKVEEYWEEVRHGGLRSHEALIYDHGGAIGTGTPSELPPAPLFKKLDESMIEDEYARLEG